MLTITGLAVGWRIHNGLGDAALAVGLSLLFAFAATWAGAYAGVLMRSPEAAQALGFIVFLPLSFVSNAFVPTQGIPAWLRDFANWNPISALAAACRKLFGGANPAASVHAWPMQHPELAVLIWSIGLIAVFRPDRGLPLPPQGPALIGRPGDGRHGGGRGLDEVGGGYLDLQAAAAAAAEHRGVLHRGGVDHHGQTLPLAHR